MYAVIFLYSFDDDVAIYPMKTEEDAKDFLLEAYNEEMRIDIEENGWDSVGELNEERTRATIRTYFDDGDCHYDITVMAVGQIYM